MDPMNVKEARAQFSCLIKAAEKGDSVTITRNGRKVARIDPIDASAAGRLPDLGAFRDSLKIKGGALSATVIRQRKKERY